MLPGRWVEAGLSVYSGVGGADRDSRSKSLIVECSQRLTVNSGSRLGLGWNWMILNIIWRKLGTKFLKSLCN